MSIKNCNETIGNRTRDLPACSAVPQPTAPPRALQQKRNILLINKQHTLQDVSSSSQNVSLTILGNLRSSMNSTIQINAVCL
jgi:hypothetical protein